jgi:hypothetical protein
VAGAGRGRIGLTGELVGTVLCTKGVKRAGRFCSPRRDGSKMITGEEGVTVIVNSDGDGFGRRSGGQGRSC